MEWNKVKTILIVLLLALNLILGVDIYLKIDGKRSIEEQSVRQAAALLEQSGTPVDVDLFLQMPVELCTYTAARDRGLEQQIAVAILGDGVQVQEPGGEISIYQNDKGEMSFRSDGFFDISFEAAPSGDEAGYFKKLLRESGFPIKDAVAASGGTDGYTLELRTPNGYPVQDAEAACVLEAGRAGISGEWVFGEIVKGAQRSASRAELILTLQQELSGRENSAAIDAVSVVYITQQTQAQQIELVPVWKVVCGEETLYCNTVSKKMLVT